MKRKRSVIFAVLLGISISLAGCEYEKWLDGISHIAKTKTQMPLESAEAFTSGGEDREAGEAKEVLGKEASGEDADQKDAAGEAKEGIPYYAYNILSESERLWYENMEEALVSMEEKALSKTGLDAGMDETDIDRIFQFVMNDHPEFFYVEGYQYTKYTRGSQTVGIVFMGSYNANNVEVESRRGRIEEEAGKLLKQAPAEGSDYEKVKYVYEILVQNTEYDLEAPDNQNIYSVFVNHKSVCQGYAKATQYLLQRLGMECTLVQGTVDTGEAHAWNLVKVDGEYYYVDTTWGDASYRMGTGENYPLSVNYDYLCVTTEQLLRTHTPGGEMPMPECTSSEANYYVKEDLLLAGYDTEKLKKIFWQAQEEQRTDVTFKCMNEACLETVKKKLLDDQEIFRYLPDTEKQISYACNDKQLSMTFWLR